MMMPQFTKYKMERVFYMAAVILFITVAKFAHAETNCDSLTLVSCRIHVNCTVNGVADSNIMQVLENTIKTHHSCYEYKKHYNSYYDRYDYEYKVYSSTEIILNMNYNLDEFWKTNIFDSHIKTVTFKTIETVPTKIKSFTNLKEIAFVDSSMHTFDLNYFLGLSSLFRINASSNLIKYLTLPIDSNNGYAQIIDLSRNKIDELPNQCFSRFSELKSLNLSHNYIKNIEILTFEGIFKLEVLDLSFNTLTKIEQSLARFVNLQELYINNNNLYSMSELHLRTLTKLEKLHLNNNQLRSIGDDAFKSLTKLEHLDLSNNYLEIIKFETSAMENLLNFKARNNSITAISKFNNFVSLQELDISDNKITKLEPEMFLYMNKLKYLDLSNNMIEDAVTAKIFNGLSDIVEIKLSQNKLTSIENDAFNGSKNLATVNFSHCNIESLGYNAFKNTGSIHTIDLSYNRINNFSLIPESVTKVEKLFINNNRIQHFSEETFASLPNLKNFTVANNNLLNGTIVLTSSNILSYVDISNTKIDVRKFLENVNTLSKFSTANTNFKTLSFEHIVNKTICNLDLSFNGIENINKVFVYNVRNISRLELRSNKLTFIDKFSFQNMPALTWLDLSCNLLSQIQPGSFMLTNNIVNLNLHGNSLEVLKFGMFEGLQNLLTLNLSDNMIREFSTNFLHSTPLLTNVVLDNNRIKDISLRSFIKSNVSVISIGGNPLSCHTLANFKHNSMYNSEIAKELIKNISLTAETFDYHNDNYHGIRCVSSFDSSDNITWPELSTDTNSTTKLMDFSKELRHFRNAIEMALKRSDDKRIFEKDTIENSNITSLLKSIDNNNTNSLENLAKNLAIVMNNNTDRLLESLKGYMKNMNAVEKTDTLPKHVNMTDMSLLDQHLNEKLKIMNNEKERLVKELQTIFEDLKISPNIKTGTQTHENGTETNDLRGILYFVAVCLTIIIMFIFTIAYKIFRESNLLKRNRIFNSCSQPIANEMELS